MSMLTFDSGLVFAPRSRPPATGPAGFIAVAHRICGDYNILEQYPSQTETRARVAGTVKEHASPADLPRARMTYLHRQKDGKRIGAVLSDAETGAYEFSPVKPGEVCFVVAFDHTGNYNAVIKSDITPDPIPWPTLT